MTSCAALQAACQEKCRADIPFWKFGQRQECQQRCAASYAACFADLTQEVEDQSNAAIEKSQENTAKLIVVIIAIIAIIFLIWLWRRIQRKG